MLDGEISEVEKLDPRQADLKSLYELLQEAKAVRDRVFGGAASSGLTQTELAERMADDFDHRRNGEFAQIHKKELEKALLQANITDRGKEMVEEEFNLGMDIGVHKASEEADPDGIFSIIGVTKSHLHPTGIYSEDPKVLMGIDRRLYEAMRVRLIETASDVANGISDSNELPIEASMEDELEDYQEEFEVKYHNELQET